MLPVSILVIDFILVEIDLRWVFFMLCDLLFGAKFVIIHILTHYRGVDDITDLSKVLNLSIFK
jgi:hypothetical protein